VKSIVVLSPESLFVDKWIQRLTACLKREFDDVQYVNCTPLERGPNFEWINPVIECLKPIDLIVLVGETAHNNVRLSLLPGVRILVVSRLDHPKWNNRTFTSLEKFISNGQSDLEVYFKETSTKLIACDLIPF